mgnify:FL=1
MCIHFNYSLLSRSILRCRLHSEHSVDFGERKHGKERIKHTCAEEDLERKGIEVGVQTKGNRLYQGPNPRSFLTQNPNNNNNTDGNGKLIEMPFFLILVKFPNYPSLPSREIHPLTSFLLLIGIWDRY